MERPLYLAKEGKAEWPFHMYARPVKHEKMKISLTNSKR